MNKKYVYSGIGIFVLVFVGLFVFSSGNNSSVTGNVVAVDSENSGLVGDSDKVTVYFFWGDGCPHCATQKPYLENWKEKYGEDLEIKMFETWKNKDNVALFQKAAQAYGIQARGVPTTFIGEKNWVGFSSSMAAEMESYIESCIKNKCAGPLQ